MNRNLESHATELVHFGAGMTAAEAIAEVTRVGMDIDGGSIHVKIVGKAKAARHYLAERRLPSGDTYVTQVAALAADWDAPELWEVVIPVAYDECGQVELAGTGAIFRSRGDANAFAAEVNKAIRG